MLEAWTPTILLLFYQFLIPAVLIVLIVATFVLVYKSYKLLKKIEEDIRFRR